MNEFLAVLVFGGHVLCANQAPLYSTKSDKIHALPLFMKSIWNPTLPVALLSNGAPRFTLHYKNIKTTGVPSLSRSPLSSHCLHAGQTHRHIFILAWLSGDCIRLPNTLHGWRRRSALAFEGLSVTLSRFHIRSHSLHFSISWQRRVINVFSPQGVEPRQPRTWAAGRALKRGTA